jgi:hypothetical protein
MNPQLSEHHKYVLLGAIAALQVTFLLVEKFYFLQHCFQEVIPVDMNHLS